MAKKVHNSQTSNETPYEAAAALGSEQRSAERVATQRSNYR